MAVVRPFRGVRPRPEVASTVASPPYDVLSSDEARQVVRDNPNSFLRVNKSEVDFPAGTDLYGDDIYRRGKENLDRLRRDKIMICDDSPCFYLYRLIWQGASQTGLVALASVDEYDRGKIKKHEFTRPEKVNDRANHIMTLKAQVGPVFSIFRQSSDLSEIFDRLTAAAPSVDFSGDDGVRHQLWVVNQDNDIRQLIDAFAAVPDLYIADGHHRSEAASEVCRRLKSANGNHTGEEPYNFFLNVIFPDHELRILSYNRVVSELNGLSPSQLLEKASVDFEISERDSAFIPDEPGKIGMYIENRWYQLEARPGSFEENDPAMSLDSAILTTNFLSPVLGIEDIRTDKRIRFVGGIRGTEELERLVDSGDFKVAFSLCPVSVAQLLRVADAGLVMPPKSTWFEPKLRSGMAVNLLEE